MTLLIGDATTTYSVADNITAGGDIQAWAFTCATTGTVDTLMFRTSTQADAGVTGLVLGIYADSATSPGTFPITGSAAIGQGTFSGRPAANTWIAVTGLSISVTGGTRYWLAAVPLGTGNVYYNDAVASGGTNVDDSSGTATSLGSVSSWNGPFGVGPAGFQGIASAPPAVTSVSPSNGTTAGGTSVTINGSGFTGATAVHFGSNLATNVAVMNDTTIICSSPAGIAGVVDVTVTTPVGTSSTSSSDHFLYQTPPPPSTPAIIMTSYAGVQAPITTAAYINLFLTNQTPPVNIAPPVITPQAPFNAIAPTISGIATHGDTLTAISGTWYNMDDSTWAPAYSFQWQTSPNGTSSWSNLGGATSMTYVVQVSDETHYLRVGVTASNTGSGGGGVVTVDSAATSQVN